MSQEGGGLKQYSTALLNILSDDLDNTYYILHNSNDPEVINIINCHDNLFLISSHISKERRWERCLFLLYKTYNTVERIRKGSNFKPIVWSYVERICKKYKIDLIHSPFQTVPYSKTKVIWTLHDVQELHFPEYFTSYQRADRARGWVENISLGSHIIVSYQHIKDDILKYFELKSEYVTVCLLDMQNLWIDNVVDFKHDLSFNDSIPIKYFLYPANTWQHKNHRILVEAVNKLKTQGNDEIKFICTGHKTDYYYDEIVPLIDKYDLHNNFHFIGLVEESVLLALYKNARCVVIPTMYEAGSFPLMESLLLNIPVICSNVTSLPEAIQNEKFLFNPLDLEYLSNLLDMAWFDDNFTEECRNNSIQQSAKLKTKSALKIIKRVYKGL